MTKLTRQEKEKTNRSEHIRKQDKNEQSNTRVIGVLKGKAKEDGAGKKWCRDNKWLRVFQN